MVTHWLGIVTIAALLGGILVPRPAFAQVDGRCGQPCVTSWVTEASYARRVAGGPVRRGADIGPPYEYGEAGEWHLTASTGFVRGLSRRVGVGAVVAAGLWSELYLSAGARLRIGLAPDLTLDVTPTYILAGADYELSPGLLDVGLMWRNRVGVTVQAGAVNTYSYDPEPPAGDPFTTVRKRLALSAGVRLGEVPGRVGILADAAALAGVYALFLLYCGSSGCD